MHNIVIAIGQALIEREGAKEHKYDPQGHEQKWAFYICILDCCFEAELYFPIGRVYEAAYVEILELVCWYRQRLFFVVLEFDVH